jgi:exosortase
LQQLVTSTGQIPAQPYAASFRANDIAWGVTLAACWFWTCRQLALTWGGSANYEFGYFVPWIAILLVIRRVSDTPGCLDAAPHAGRSGRLLTSTGLVVAWGAFLLAELVRQFDPHWRMIGWLMMSSVTLLTGLALWRRGGRRSLLALAFPVAFMWCAVPWPTNVEETITLGLRSFVTSGSVGILHAMGIHAGVHGNVIDLAGGSVVVDSACSGINSLQASIMASLFLGEYFGFRTSRRVALLLTGTLIAIGGNLLRATGLVLIANARGATGLEAWHDKLGLAETSGIFIGIVAAAWLFSRKPLSSWHPAAAASVPTAAQPIGALRLEGWAALAAFASIPLLATAWFAISPGGPIRRQEAPLWTVKSNPASSAWHIEPINLSASDLRTLDFNEGDAISLEGPADRGAVIYHFFWKTDASTGYGHTPDHCMAGAGWELEGQPQPATLRVSNQDFPGKFYRFKRDGDEQVVFQSIWYGGDPMLSNGEFPYAKGGPRTSRLAMLWDQPRRRGLESLNVYLQPSPDLLAQTQEVLAQILVPNR